MDTCKINAFFSGTIVHMFTANSKNNNFEKTNFLS